MSELKVLLITVRADYGGGPEHVYQLVSHVRNTDCYIACPIDEPYWRKYQEVLNNNILDIPHRKVTFASLIRLARFIKENDIAIVHTHGKGAGLYGRLLRIITGAPCIHTPHGIHVGDYSSLQKKIYQLYENLTGMLISKIIFVSEAEKQEASHQGLWGKICNTVIENGVCEILDEDKSCWRTEIRNALNLAPNRFLIVTISRFDYQKNMDEAFEIVKKLPMYTFLWIGDGEDKARLEMQSQESGLKNIIFAGFQESPKKYLAAADVYLSTSRWEGLPISLLEAMSLGLPIIASNVVGNDELVCQGENGFLYSLGDIEYAASCIDEIHEERNYISMSQKSRRIQKEKYSIGHMVKKIEQLYQKVVDDAC